MLERAAVLEVSGNPRGAERVAANFCRDTGGGRAAADHPPASMQVRTRLSPGGRWIRTLGPPVREAFFRDQPGTRQLKTGPVARTDFDDRQGQVYPAPSQAGPGNDINAGSA